MTKEVVDFKQGVTDEYINYAFDMINNAFSREVSKANNGADSKIRFCLAEFDTDGENSH